MRDNLPYKRRTDLETNTIELMWIEIALKPKSMFIGICYRPPGQNRNEAATFIANLQEQIQNVVSLNIASLYIMGDFNDRCAIWDDNHHSSELKLDLVDLLNSFDLSQIISEPTHFTGTSQTLLDLIITDSPAHIVKTGTLAPIGLSHHCVVYCETSSQCKKTSYYRDYWDIKRADYDGLNNALAEFPWHAIVEDDVNKMAANWSSILLEMAKEYIPFRKVLIRTRDKPWITPDIHIK